MLEANNIWYGYSKNAPLYEGICLSVAKDERVALCAPSGFGKTTLCKILSGYITPDKGSVLVDGEKLPKRGVCPVQMIWQHPERALDPRMKMKDSLAEAGNIDEGVLERLGIQEKWMTRYPHELSGGELQRFCIARAFGVHPKYLIADEMSTMLDAVTQAKLWRYLVDTCEESEIGLIFVSHSEALTQRIATRVVTLG